MAKISTFLSAIFLVALTLITAKNAGAQCMLVPIAMQTKVAASSAIVEGRVFDKKCLWDESMANIYTVYSVEVFKKFKNFNIADTIRFVDAGGQVGMQKQITTNTVHPELGEVGVFMLQASTAPFDASNNYLQITEGPQGFIVYDRLTKKAAWPFSDEINVMPNVYDSLSYYTNTSYTEVKLLDWGAWTPKNSSAKLINNANNNPTAIAASAAITSFSPTSITAGTFDTLTINGSGFGATQGTSFVQFSNASAGAIPTYKSEINASSYLSWSDTKIEMLLPTFAGTGNIRVTDGTTTKTSAATLTVTYALISIEFDAKYWPPNHFNTNTKGGYTFNFSTGYTLPAAQADFIAAMQAWRCASGINWEIASGTSTVTAIANDGVGLVNYDVTTPLASGTLGQVTSRYSGCIAGADTFWNIEELDVNMNDAPGGSLTWLYGGTGTPTIMQYDFYSVMIHEMGHACQVDHVLNVGDFMYPSLVNGSAVRSFLPADSNAAQHQVARSTSATHLDLCYGSPSFTFMEYSCNPKITLSASGTSVLEGVATLTITANSDYVNENAITVNISTSGSATGAGTDYNLASTSITIPAWTKSGTTTLAIVNDVIFEGNETIILDIASVINGTEDGLQQQTITITDNDPAPSVSLSTSATSITENGSGINLIATLSSVSTLPTTALLSYSGTATNGTDFTQVMSLVIPAGSTTVAALLAPIDDAIFEGNETIIIDINTVTNGTENGVQQQTINLLDDEIAPIANLDTLSFSGSESLFSVPVQITLSNASALPTTVYFTFSGSASISDYSYSGASIVFAPGATTETLEVDFLNDLIYEGDETIIVTIDSVVNGTIGTEIAKQITIIDDENIPTTSLSVDMSSFTENAGSATVTATLDIESALATVVYLNTSGTATLATDFSGNADSIVIAAGSLTTNIILTAIQDAIDEEDETIIIDIDSVKNATENGVQQITTVINDDDLAPTVSLTIADSVGEASGSLSGQLNLSTPSGKNIVIYLSAMDSTAGSMDYALGSDSVILFAGDTSASFTIAIANDLDDEASIEYFILKIDSAINATLPSSTNTSIGINDDELSNSVLNINSIAINGTGNYTIGNGQASLAGTFNAYVANNGNAPLIWTLIDSTSNIFTGIAGTTYTTFPGDTLFFTTNVDISCNNTSGQDSAILVINSNDDNDPIQVLTLVVNVIDTIAPMPTISSLPTVYFDCAGTLTVIPTAQDICANNINGITTSNLNFSSIGTYTVSWNYLASNNLTVTQNQIIIVQDTIAPVPDSMMLPTITATCSVVVSAVPTATDLCNGVINATTVDSLTYATAGTYNITWMYKDLQGNTSTQIQQVLITNGLPIVDVQVSTSAICNGSLITLSGIGASAYTWTGGISDNVSFNILASDTYTVIGTDGAGCTSTSSINLMIDPIVVANSVNNNLDNFAGTTCASASQADGTTIYYNDANCGLVVGITDSVGGNALGNVNACVVESDSVKMYGNGKYLSRYFYITPQNQGAATISFYFTQADFDLFNIDAIANGTPQIYLNPQNQYELTCTQVPGDSIALIGTGVAIPHSVVAIYDSTMNFWKIDLAVASFSGFFFHPSLNNSPLNTTQIKLQGIAQGSVHHLNWTTVGNISAPFKVLHSTDSKNFKELAITNKNYLVRKDMDCQKHYYKVSDGASQSNVIMLQNKCIAAIEAYPNPFGNQLTVSIHTTQSSPLYISLVDAVGKSIVTQENNLSIGTNTIDLAVGHLTTGTYMLVVKTNLEQKVIKVTKQ
jgi:hypothetical protein